MFFFDFIVASLPATSLSRVFILGHHLRIIAGFIAASLFRCGVSLSNIRADGLPIHALFIQFRKRPLVFPHSFFSGLFSGLNAASIILCSSRTLEYYFGLHRGEPTSLRLSFFKRILLETFRDASCSFRNGSSGSPRLATDFVFFTPPSGRRLVWASLRRGLFPVFFLIPICFSSALSSSGQLSTTGAAHAALNSRNYWSQIKSIQQWAALNDWSRPRGSQQLEILVPVQLSSKVGNSQ